MLVLNSVINNVIEVSGFTSNLTQQYLQFDDLDARPKFDIGVFCKHLVRKLK